MKLLVALSTLVSLVLSSPIELSRGQEAALCQAATSAYRAAREEGKRPKMAAVMAAKTFYVQFALAPVGGTLAPCERVDETLDLALAAMHAYFNAAAATDTEVLSPVCKAATLAYLEARIARKSEAKATVAAGNAYMRAMEGELGGDPGRGCFKSQEFIKEL